MAFSLGHLMQFHMAISITKERYCQSRQLGNWWAKKPTSMKWSQLRSKRRRRWRWSQVSCFCG